MDHKDIAKLFEELAGINEAFRSLLRRLAILFISTLLLGVAIGWMLRLLLNR